MTRGAATAVVVALCVGGVAHGKPAHLLDGDGHAQLAPELVLEVEGSIVRARRDDAHEPVDVYACGVARAERVELSAHGTAITIFCGEILTNSPDNGPGSHVVAHSANESLTFVTMRALIEAHDGETAYAQHRGADAEAAYARALALEPTLPRARDLALVQLSTGKRDDAGKTLQPFVSKAPVASYLRLLMEPAFAPLADVPGVRLTAPTPGTATIDLAARRISGQPFVVTDTLVAAIVEFENPGGTSTALHVVDRATGAPVVGVEVSGEFVVPPAQRFLRDLGFVAPTDIEIATGTARIALPISGLAVALDGRGSSSTGRAAAGRRGSIDAGRHPVARLVRGSHTVARAPIDGNVAYLAWAAWSPSLALAIVAWQDATPLGTAGFVVLHAADSHAH